MNTIQNINSAYDLLGNCLEESILQLSVEKIYHHPSHNFKVSGDKYRGGCPFHESKSGTSFNVTETNKLFYCFGCQSGGSPVEYLHSLKVGRWEKPRGKDFVDIVRELASLANIPFPEYKLSPEQIEKARKWELRRSILQATTEYCQEILWSDRGLKAREYLIEKRGLTEDAIKDLGLGSLPNYSELKKALQDRGFDSQDINIVRLKALEGYITYPWLDANSRPLTMYGRWHTHIPPEGKPKTIALLGKSTKRSPLYLDRALKSGYSEIVLVEGVNDAALAQSLGITNVCAYVGASCSNEQIETLKRKGIKKVILCGDPDTAGDNGTASNLNRMIQAGISIYIAPKLPNNLDPDEFIIQNGVEEWHKHINNAEHGFRWQAKRFIAKYGTNNDSAIRELTSVAVSWVATIPSSRIKELDTFFWSEIDRHTGAISSSKVYEFIHQLQAPNELHAINVKSFSESDQAEYLKQEINRLIDAGASEADIELIIPGLAKKCDRSPNDIWRLFQACEKQSAQEENQDLFKQEVKNLLHISRQDVKLDAYIPKDLAILLEQLAVYLGVNRASLLTTLLTVSASLLPITTSLKLIEATNFYAHSILYTGICAESGSGKSPLIKVFINPLSRLQQEEEKRYQLELTAYEQGYKEWKKSDLKTDAPVKPKPPREYIVTDATSEAIASIQNNQPNNGFLGWFDELTALMGQQNAYRGGKGADAEKILSGRDGTGFKINRAGGTRINCIRSGYSILGGIQPDILKKHMGDFSDPSGFWARFIWVILPVKKKTFPEDSVQIEVDDLLYALYKKLGTINSVFELSSEGKVIFQQWYENSEALKIAEPRQALRAVYAKSQRLVGELALLLHCINYSLYEQEPPKEVELKTMEVAVELTKFYINQVQLIHANSSGSSDNLPSVHLKIITLSHRKGWLKARDVQTSIRPLKKESPSRIRAIFRELEASGYGITKFEGQKLIWNANSVDKIDQQ